MTIEVKGDTSKALVDAERLVRCHIREKFHIYSFILAAPLSCTGQMIGNFIQRCEVLPPYPAGRSAGHSRVGDAVRFIAAPVSLAHILRARAHAQRSQTQRQHQQNAPNLFPHSVPPVVMVFPRLPAAERVPRRRSVYHFCYTGPGRVCKSFQSMRFRVDG